MHIQILNWSPGIRSDAHRILRKRRECDVEEPLFCATTPHKNSKVHCNIDEAIETFEKSKSKKLALVHVYPEIHKDFNKNKNVFIPNDLDTINI